MNRKILPIACFFALGFFICDVRGVEVGVDGEQIRVTASSERVLDVLFSVQTKWKAMPHCIVENWPEEVGFIESTDRNGNVSKFGVKSDPVSFRFAGKSPELLDSLTSDLGARFDCRKTSDCYHIINRDFARSAMWPLNDPLDPGRTRAPMTLSQCYACLQAHHHLSRPPGSCPLPCEEENVVCWKGWFPGARVRDMVRSMALAQDKRKVIECYPFNLTEFERTPEDGVYRFPEKGKPVDWAINS